MSDPIVLEGRIDSLHGFTWVPEGGDHPTQVHLLIEAQEVGLSGLPLASGRKQYTVVRFKGPDTLRQLVAALIEHAAPIWGGE